MNIITAGKYVKSTFHIFIRNNSKYGTKQNKTKMYKKKYK